MRSASTSPMPGSVFSCSRLALLMSIGGAGFSAGCAFFAATAAEVPGAAAAEVAAGAQTIQLASANANAWAFGHLDRCGFVTMTPRLFQRDRWWHEPPQGRCSRAAARQRRAATEPSITVMPRLLRMHHLDVRDASGPMAAHAELGPGQRGAARRVDRRIAGDLHVRPLDRRVVAHEALRGDR